jgi:hypothetical protein
LIGAGKRGREASRVQRLSLFAAGFQLVEDLIQSRGDLLSTLESQLESQRELRNREYALEIAAHYG